VCFTGDAAGAVEAYRCTSFAVAPGAAVPPRVDARVLTYVRRVAAVGEARSLFPDGGVGEALASTSADFDRAAEPLGPWEAAAAAAVDADL